MNNEDKIKLMNFLIEHKLIKLDSWSYCGIEENIIVFPTNYVTIEDKELVESVKKVLKK